MTSTISCPKCGGTVSYQSIQNGRRVPMCKTCSEVMYAPGAQEKEEKFVKAVFSGATVLVIGFAAWLVVYFFG